MIADPLDIIHHMEQCTDILQILDRQCRLVDLHQIMRDGMTQKVNILLYFPHLLYFILIQCHKHIHSAVQILNGKRRHTIQLLDRLHNSRGWI